MTVVERWIVAVGIVVLSGCGGSELRGALNDITEPPNSCVAKSSDREVHGWSTFAGLWWLGFIAVLRGG